MICRHTDAEIRAGAHDRGYDGGGGGGGIRSDSPDATRFEIEEVEEVGGHLVLKVRYPNCASCAYEGNKVMVFIDATVKQVLRWKKIDPHFRAPSRTVLATEAPSPAARFPASPEGWQDALDYARRKARPVMR